MSYLNSFHTAYETYLGAVLWGLAALLVLQVIIYLILRQRHNDKINLAARKRLYAALRKSRGDG